MKFYIGTDNGSGQKFGTKEEFLKELGLMIALTMAEHILMFWLMQAAFL